MLASCVVSYPIGRMDIFQVVNMGLDMERTRCYNYTMKTLSDTLKKAITESGLSDKRLGELTGVNRLSIGRFMAGTQYLSMAQAEMLAVFFGLELKPAQRRGKKSKG